VVKVANYSLLTTIVIIINMRGILEAAMIKIKKHNQAFGKVICKLRHEKKYSQEFLGFEADLTRAYISLLERGLRSPTLDTMMALREPLGVSLTLLSTQIDAELDAES
jgi:DNA-binding XRE family transcriptional regulator